MALSKSFSINDKKKTRVYDFVIDARLGAPDGFERRMFVINGQSEGPLIEANQGDTLHIKVTNNLNTGITLHWHGMAQNGTTWADGPNGITQCPIPAGQSFDYVFDLNREDQYGTYWYHAHRGAMYSDGLTGPLIIHSPNDPLVRGTDYDLDQIVFVRDHFHSMSTDIVDDLLTTAGFDGTFIAPSPKSGLINGAGVFNCSLAPEGSTCNTKAPIELVFPPNKKIRLRFVNAGSHAQFKVSVDNHTLEVIEADDTPVYGPTVHRIPINVAQRYSAILDTTGDKQGDAYYLRAQINTDCFGAPFADLDPDVKAIIRISKTNKTPSTNTPTSVDWTDALGGVCTDLDESTLVPRIAVDAPALPDVSYVWNAAFNFTQAGIFIWTLNGVTLENFMYNPLYFQVYKGETINSTLVNNLVVDGIQTVDLVINNLLAADHPFHLHGSKFWIVARGTGQLLESDLPNVTYNTTNPMRRDVLAVPVGQWAIIRIISDIPGVHAFHCHIAWHQAAGLFGVFVIQPDQIQQADIPDSSFALCDASNFEGNLGLLTIDPGRRRRALDAYPHNRRRSVTANATPIKKRWESSFVKKAVINHHPRKH